MNPAICTSRSVFSPTYIEGCGAGPHGGAHEAGAHRWVQRLPAGLNLEGRRPQPQKRAPNQIRETDPISTMHAISGC